MSATSPRPGISVAGVHKVFRRRSADATGGGTTFKALDNVSIEIGSREFVSIVGSSGCGKTTLLRMIAGLTRPDAGAITVDSKDVRGPGPERAMVFQHAALLPWADVTRNVALGLKLRGVDRQTRLARAREAIEMVGLQGFEAALPRELSGGMQQRVGLARALVVNPDYLLMDEPFGSLDEITRRGMQAELLRIWSTQDKGAVFVTHSVDEAVILSDRIVVMSPRPGRVVADIRIPLPAPRSHEMEATPEFAAIRYQVWEALDEASRTSAQGVGAGRAAAS